MLLNSNRREHKCFYPTTPSRSGFLSRFIKKESASEGQSASLGQEISWPKDVKHELHIGWDPLKGFEIRNIPPEWKKLFKAAGQFLRTAYICFYLLTCGKSHLEQVSAKVNLRMLRLLDSLWKRSLRPQHRSAKFALTARE